MQEKIICDFWWVQKTLPLISMEKSSSDGAEQRLMIEPERLRKSRKIQKEIREVINRTRQSWGALKSKKVAAARVHVSDMRVNIWMEIDQQQRRPSLNSN